MFTWRPHRPARRTARLGGLVLGISLLAIAAGVSSVTALIRLSWPYVEEPGNPEWGINYSCNNSEYLLLEVGDQEVPDSRPGRAEWCAENFSTILEKSGAKHVRLSVEWRQVEPARDQFDFRLLDALLEVAEERGVRVLITIGLKAQRHPEYYVPNWLRESLNLEGATVITDVPEVRERALTMARAVLEHIAQSPAIEAWGAENEPYVESHRAVYWKNWTIGRDFVNELAALIREVDPLDRPITMNHGQHWSSDETWRIALEDADILSSSMYPFRNYTLFGHDFVVDLNQMGPLTVNYANQARTAEAAGKALWIAELQAEPWTNIDARLITPDNPSPNLSPEKMRKVIDYGRRSGAARVYLWGSEWWLLQSEFYGDERWFDVAREVLVKSP